MGEEQSSSSISTRGRIVSRQGGIHDGLAKRCAGVSGVLSTGLGYNAVRCQWQSGGASRPRWNVSHWLLVLRSVATSRRRQAADV